MSLPPPLLRKLDCLVAEHVMGYWWVNTCGRVFLVPQGHFTDHYHVAYGKQGCGAEDITPFYSDYRNLGVPKYSSDWLMIPKILNALEKRSPMWMGSLIRKSGCHQPWSEVFWACELRKICGGQDTFAWAATSHAPLSVAIASLRAAGISDDVIKAAVEDQAPGVFE